MCKSKYNNERENQVILLMISERIDGVEKRNYLALKSESTQYNEKSCRRPVKSLSRLLNGISSNHAGDFYCLNCFNSYSSENKLKEHEEICNKHYSCHLIMPELDEKPLKYNHGKKPFKAPCVIYLDLECLLLKMLSCQNDSNNTYTERKAMHEPSGWTILTNCLFDKAKSKLDYCRGIDCIKVLCEKFKDRALRIINYEKKEMIPSSEEENKSYEEQDICHICRKKFNSDIKDKKHQKLKDHCRYTGKI